MKTSARGLTAGTVFTVELLQRFFSQDYRAMAAMNAGAGWAPIALFGRDWLPTALATWAVPLGLWAVGAALVRATARLWHALQECADSTEPPTVQQGSAL